MSFFVPRSARGPKPCGAACAALLFVLTIALGTPPKVQSQESLWWGVRGYLGAATASGSGYWDWVTPDITGTTHPGPSLGAALAVQQQVSRRILLETGVSWHSTQVQQSVGPLSIDYRERFLSFPLAVHISPQLLSSGSSRSVPSIVVGPSVTVMPFEGERQLRSSDGSSENRSGITDSIFHATLEAGLEWTVATSPHSKTVVGARFSHRLGSPKYRWIEDSAGNNRTDRLDLTIGWFFQNSAEPDAGRAGPLTGNRGEDPGKAPGSPLRVGVEVSAAAAIGTAKAHWDWYGNGTVGRLIVPSGTLGVTVGAPVSSHVTVATGGRFGFNSTAMTVQGQRWEYSHNSIEFPLVAELHLAPVVAWGGPVLLWLPGDARITPEGAFALASGRPGRRVHPALEAGIGVQGARARTYVRYVSFFTSPEYQRRISGESGAADQQLPAGDLRWHRFEAGVVWYPFAP